MRLARDFSPWYRKNSFLRPEDERTSLKYLLRVKLNPVQPQQLKEFLLEALPLMMLFLPANVAFNCWYR
jgi:hypothetical protein